MVDALGRFLKVQVIAEFVVGNESLWVARNEWKPGTLNLDHDAVAFFECMHNAGHRVGNLRWSVCFQR